MTRQETIGGKCPEAWYEGVEARRVGRCVTQAPYHPNSHAFKAWVNGWMAAEMLTAKTAGPDTGTMHLNI